MKATSCSSCSGVVFWQQQGESTARCEACDPPAGRPVRRRAQIVSGAWQVIYEAAEENGRRKKCAEGCWQQPEKWQRKPSKKYRGKIVVTCRECGRFIAYEKKGEAKK